MSEINPWLSIPSEDYDGHMGSESVNQLSFLSSILHSDLNTFSPEKVLLAGCATGNGLEHFRKKQVSKIVAMDINEEFLQIARGRFSDIPDLEVIQGNVEEDTVGMFSYIFSGLILEYVDVEKTLNNFYCSLENKGIMTVIIQLESKTLSSVSPTKFKSLENLSSIMKHIQPTDLKSISKTIGFDFSSEEKQILKSGKEFMIYRFTKK